LVFISSVRIPADTLLTLISRKVYKHCGIRTGVRKNGQPNCDKFPAPLVATSEAQCLEERTFEGLDLFFRYIHLSILVADVFVREVQGQQTNFRVTLKAVGRALLPHVVVNLNMREMNSLYQIEYLKDLQTTSLVQRIGRRT